MNSDESCSLDQLLQVVGRPIADVLVSVFVWLVRHLEEFIDLGLVHSSNASEFGKSIICCITGLVNDIGIEELRLLVEERFRKGLRGALDGASS